MSVVLPNGEMQDKKQKLMPVVLHSGGDVKINQRWQWWWPNSFFYFSCYVFSLASNWTPVACWLSLFVITSLIALI
ncbi:hypothetical protein Hdeb2414_s0023g00634981 [Helianthus debilis subsp. tardiflorus]